MIAQPLTIKQVSAMSKAQLRQLAYEDAERRGRRWVLGGPKDMSKDELVAYIVRETELVKR